MATIKPFRALRPEPSYSGKLKDLLEAPARVRPETEERQMAAYAEIRNRIDLLKAQGNLHLDEQAGIYIYEIVQPGYRQTGIWTLTAVQDYVEGRIKLHEQTLADSERRICNYRRHTGLEGSPIVLTYPSDETINRIIGEACNAHPEAATNRILKIEDPVTVNELIKAFKGIEESYLADGHHRLAGTVRNNPDSWISSLYIASDQLRIIDYHRVVIPQLPINKTYLLQRLAEICEIKQDFKRRSKGSFELYVDGIWYELQLNNSEALDVVSLQEQILAPLFGITDPRTDSRLKCIGGESADLEIDSLLKLHPEAIAFKLQPMSVDDLMAAAAKGQLLPPKSTWVDPKVPYGLLMYQHSFEGKDISALHYD
ncbi:DUF1015 family protein [Mucilaginibacter corticis]|nr:DUF1015 family protein [Mucilaginibacter corticis]